jgi:putative spermidine/putrescine transport system permease protein
MFTFSLSLGDYITAQIIGGKLQMLGNVVYQNFSINLPFDATIAAVPVLIMAFYLWLVRRTGALADL